MRPRNLKISETLDVTGLRCPLPLLKARKRLSELADGAVLEVLATDPGSWKDFHAFIEYSTNSMLYSAEKDGVFTYIMQKGE